MKIHDPLPERITLRVSPKILLGALFYLILAAAGLWALTFNLSPAGLILGIGFVAGSLTLALTRVAAWSGLWGGLNLDETGFDYRYLFFPIRKRWADCSEFWPAFLANGPGISFQTVPDTGTNPVTGERLSYGTVPDYFELDRHTLAILMNRFRSRALGSAT